MIYGIDRDVTDCTVDCGQEVACWFKCRKNSIGFDRSNYTHSTNLEMDGSVLEEK